MRGGDGGLGFTEGGTGAGRIATARGWFFGITTGGGGGATARLTGTRANVVGAATCGTAVNAAAFGAAASGAAKELPAGLAAGMAATGAGVGSAAGRLGFGSVWPLLPGRARGTIAAFGVTGAASTSGFVPETEVTDGVRERAADFCATADGSDTAAAGGAACETAAGTATGAGAGAARTACGPEFAGDAGATAAAGAADRLITVLIIVVL